jgi:hypothetical protein
MRSRNSRTAEVDQQQVDVWVAFGNFLRSVKAEQLLTKEVCHGAYLQIID